MTVCVTWIYYFRENGIETYLRAGVKETDFWNICGSLPFKVMKLCLRLILNFYCFTLRRSVFTLQFISTDIVLTSINILITFKKDVSASSFQKLNVRDIAISCLSQQNLPQIWTPIILKWKIFSYNLFDISIKEMSQLISLLST